MRSDFALCAILGTLSLGIACGQTGLGKADPNDVKELAKAEQNYVSAKKTYHLHSSAKSKQSLVVATDVYAMTSMMSAALPPKVKYRQALKLYREALKLDPKNHEAQKNSDLITSIYRSMHRPVPQG